MSCATSGQLETHQMTSEDDGAAFSARFAQLVANQDGRRLHLLLRSAGHRSKRPRDEEVQPAQRPADTTAGMLLLARGAVAREARLEALLAALRNWCTRYLEWRDGPDEWMVLPLLQLEATPRLLADQLDRKTGSGRSRKKLVEVFREQFQRLHRDGSKRAGALVICCGLLRLYFGLGQANQCSFLLAAVSKQAQRGGEQSLGLEQLPKALAVTLCFLWGKHCVLDGKVAEAEERLGWALANCPTASKTQRRQILAHLVPCRLRFGRPLARSTMRHHGLEDCFAGLAACVTQGDVRGFSRELQFHEAELISVGTYLVVEKLKLLAYRNLCRAVHSQQCAQAEQAGRASHQHKQDLTPYECAFRWQDNCDADETICILAHLIYIGAIRGYLSDEHRKVVFSRDLPFPDPATWCPKA